MADNKELGGIVDNVLTEIFEHTGGFSKVLLLNELKPLIEYAQRETERAYDLKTTKERLISEKHDLIIENGDKGMIVTVLTAKIPDLKYKLDVCNMAFDARTDIDADEIKELKARINALEAD